MYKLLKNKGKLKSLGMSSQHICALRRSGGHLPQGMALGHRREDTLKSSGYLIPILVNPSYAVLPHP